MSIIYVTKTLETEGGREVEVTAELDVGTSYDGSTGYWIEDFYSADGNKTVDRWLKRYQKIIHKRLDDMIEWDDCQPYYNEDEGKDR